jgi:HEAT repeat protein
VSALVEGVQQASPWSVRQDCARLIGQIGSGDEALIETLWRGLLDPDNDVRAACAQALALLGRRFPQIKELIAAKLAQAIRAPEFAEPDQLANRIGHDYAFDGLWLLVAGGSLE